MNNEHTSPVADPGRRRFMQQLGTGAVATSVLLSSCSEGSQRTAEQSPSLTGDIPTDQMTYRTNPKTCEQVSLLGYGCMRWPTLKEEGDPIDQETVNRLVDYAIAHGVNYFDTSPAYCKGMSERATGIALKRHPR